MSEPAHGASSGRPDPSKYNEDDLICWGLLETLRNLVDGAHPVPLLAEQRELEHLLYGEP